MTGGLPASMSVLRTRALVAGLTALGLCAIGGFFDADQLFRSYLLAYMFWFGVAIGSLAIVMIHHVTGGAWGLVIRRLLEAGARTLPFMALLFVPVAIGMKSLYPWARPELVAADELLQHKQAYLNTAFFLARAAVYFAAWSALAWTLSGMSREQDRTGDERLIRRFVLFSAGGLLVLVLTLTFASVDWVMSLEPHWFSTIYGPLLMSGQAVSAFCFAIVVAVVLARSKAPNDMTRAVTPGHMHDLGKLLFAFVLVWAYFALSQFLIVWSGNLPEEIPWYLRRTRGGWQWVGLGIILLHFALPFSLLLMRRVKRDAARLLRVALLVLVMRLVDTWWMIAPAFGEGALAVHWMDAAATAGLGGLWVHLFLRQLAGAALLPARDPLLGEAMEGEA